MSKNFLLALVACALATAGLVHAAAVGTAFTYQGELRRLGAAVTGSYDVEARVFADADGTVQVGSVAERGNVSVKDGIFSVELDFGAAFADDARWLELRLRQSGEASFERLLPRQRITPTPHALRAASALVADGAVQAGSVPWTGVTGLPAGFADNDDADGLAAVGCQPGQELRRGAAGWQCEVAALGTVTAVAAGTGLQGGTITQAGTVSVAPSGITQSLLANDSVDGAKVIDGSLSAQDANLASLQARVQSPCSAGSFLQAIAADGTVTCASAAAGVTRVDAGSGLAGGPVTSTGTLSVAPLGIAQSMLAANSVNGAKVQDGTLGSDDLDASIQRRVTGTCAVGNVVSAINADGSVQCKPLALAPRYAAPDVGAWDSISSMSVAMGPGGLPRIVASLAGSTPNFARCTNAACTTLPSMSFISGMGTFSDMHVPANDLPLIAVSGGTTTKVLMCADVACQVKQTVTISDPSPDALSSYHHAMAVNAAVAPAFTFRNNTTGALYFRRCLAATCTNRGPQAQITGVGGQMPALALRGNGNPVIVSTGASELEFTLCGDPDCTSYTYSGTQRGLWADVLVPADDRPIAAAVSADNVSVVYYRCTTPACSGFVRRTFVTGNQPQLLRPRIDLFLDADGFPTIAFSTSSQLYVSHCGNMDCTSVLHGVTELGRSVFAATSGSTGSLFAAGQDFSISPLSTVQCYTPACE